MRKKEQKDDRILFTEKNYMRQSFANIRLFLLLSALFSMPLQAKNLHVLLSADTITDVKLSSFQDLKHLRNEFATIANATGMGLRIKELYGPMLTRKQIEAWIDREPIAEDDVIFFYYTGHGVRSRKSKTIWPCAYFPHDEEMVEMQTLIEKLIRRPAALHLIIADCCNNYVDRSIPSSDPLTIEKSIFTPSMQDGYKKLFLKSKGVIVASGSIPGKRAWCTEKGGIFTNAFISSMHHELTESNPRWEHIFKKTKVLCNHMQTPQFELMLLPHSKSTNLHHKKTIK